MSKPFGISVAFAALILTTAPAIGQRHPGPSKLRDADHSPPTTVIAAPGNDSSTDGHVKVFDGATLRAGDPQPDNAADGHVKVFDGATLRAGEPQPQEAAKPRLFARKAGEPPEAAPQPEGEESAAARMQTQNNLKQIGLGAH